MIDSSRIRRLWLPATVLLAVMVIAIAITRAAAQPLNAPIYKPAPVAVDAAAMQSVAIADDLAPTNCRYGAAYLMGFDDSLNWINTLDAGWYLNFSTFAPAVPSAEFAPVVVVKQVIVNGVRQPRVTFDPPLTSYYLDANGRLRPGLATIIAQNPGRLWLVGNEPDVDNQIQGNTMPDIYARAYHEAYTFIKRADPTAKVANGALSMMTPGRLQYLDIVWDTYRAIYKQDMPVDVWNMHLYILEERNPSNPNQYGDGKVALGTDPALAKLTSYGDAQFCPAAFAQDIPANDPRADVYCRSEHDSIRIFKEQVYAMRQWMKDHGEQDKPLILSEYGLLYPYLGGQPDGSCEFLQDEHQRCFTPARVTNFLRDTIRFMEETTDPALGYPNDGNRLVQQWMWYSIVTEPEWSGGSSNLIVRNYRDFPSGSEAALTQAGEAFREEAVGRIGASNLTGGAAANVSAYLKKGRNTGSAMLTASFRNSGTKSVIEPFDVTFYRDPALTQVIGKVTVQPATTGAITGCSWEQRNTEQVQLLWDNLPVGTHTYWAKVDSGNVVGESSETDNVTARGTVIVRPNHVFVPAVGTMR